jgi:hypothetical protein
MYFTYDALAEVVKFLPNSLNTILFKTVEVIDDISLFNIDLGC